MKKWKNLLGLFLAVILVRVEHTGTRIDRMEAVETVLIRQTETGIAVETDTGAQGYGENLTQAIENLHSSSSAIVFLETANYLLLSAGTEELVPQLDMFLRPNTLVCKMAAQTDLLEVTDYLKIHPPGIRLIDLKAGHRVQTLYYRKGRGQLAQ